MRRYEENIEKRFKDEKRPLKGVVMIHLFNKVWRTGRLVQKTGKPAHLVIYSPEDKEYHVYGEEAKALVPQREMDSGDWDKSDPAKVKIYILTSILDEKENWSFDMTEPAPDSGRMVKVIYDNGKIEYRTSTGNWETTGERYWDPFFGLSSNGRVSEIKEKGTWKHKKIVAWRTK